MWLFPVVGFEASVAGRWLEGMGAADGIGGVMLGLEGSERSRTNCFESANPRTKRWWWLHVAGVGLGGCE